MQPSTNHSLRVMGAYSLATVFGAGLVPKAPGTMGTLAAVPLVWILADQHWIFRFLVCGVVFLAGIWAASVVEKHSGKEDDQRIVIDEFLGYLVTMQGVTFNLPLAVLGVILFRLFDILKPFPVGWADKKVKGALGVMLDDLLAAGYAWLILYALSVFFFHQCEDILISTHPFYSWPAIPSSV